jgi:glycosyltransferase involved in cell wall biosynthesis
VARRRLLTVGHSYVIAVNRRLAHEFARVGERDWEVTCVAPRTYHADLGLERFQPIPDEPCRALAVSAYGTRSVHTFAYSPKLRSMLKGGWDAVYCWEEPYILAGFQVASWTPTGTVFTVFTAQNVRKRYPPPFSWFERRTLERADGWFHCGQLTFEAQRDKPGYAERPSRPGPLGVDVELFRPDPAARTSVRERLGWGGTGPPVVGFVGRFVAEKGVEVLARALDDAKEPWRALFLGGGPLEPKLRRWAADKGDRVRIVTLPHSEVAAYLNAMDMLCVPSQTTPQWAEQFGRTVIEGMACALPVVGSDSGEIPNTLGDAGLVVREDDSAAWTRAIDELLGAEHRRAELGARGLERAHHVYSWPIVARAYLGFLDELCAARR